MNEDDRRSLSSHSHHRPYVDGLPIRLSWCRWPSTPQVRAPCSAPPGPRDVGVSRTDPALVCPGKPRGARCAGGDPRDRYAKTTDGVHLAYQVAGDGPIDFVVVGSAFIASVDLSWEFPPTAALSRFFAARGRALLFDRRGIGMSDPVNAEDLPPLEVRIEDLHAVMDAAGVDRAVLFGVEEGAAQCLLFGATYPERTAAIIVNGASARGSWAPDATLCVGDR